MTLTKKLRKLLRKDLLTYSELWHQIVSIQNWIQHYCMYEFGQVIKFYNSCFLTFTLGVLVLTHSENYFEDFKAIE